MEIKIDETCGELLLFLEKFMFHEPGVFIERLDSIFAKKIVPACFGSIGARVCSQAPTLQLYYEGKVMKTIFPKKTCTY